MPVTDISDEELLRRAVQNIRPRRRVARWVATMELLGLGSTYAHEICARFGLDPDEEIKAR
jgi:ribosomal protein S13